MASKPIVGICRFSYVGVDDWIIYRKGGKRPALTDELFQSVAAKLYDPKRLNLRFWLFENVLMPSLLGQRDQNFEFIVITSPEMPALYMERLKKACAQIPRIRLVISGERQLRKALVPEITRIRDENGGAFPVQFRIDDDDCLSKHFTADLRTGAQVMLNTMLTDRKFAISMPDSLLLVAFANQPQAFYKWHSPFHSAGCAVYTENPNETVFSWGHNLLPRIMPTLMMPRMYNSFQTKFDGNDSGDHVMRYQKHQTEPADAETVSRLYTNRFPFLQSVDFSVPTRLAKAALA